MISKCPFYQGELVYPVDEKRKAKEGAFRVVGIIKDWNMYKGTEKNEHKVPWPKNDNPSLIHAYCFADQVMYHCTTNYFRVMTLQEKEEFVAKNLSRREGE